MRKLHLALCLLLGLGGILPQAHAQTAASLEQRELVQKFWMAFQSGKTMMTNMDIEDYICATNLSDEMMISLFKEADQDFDRYNILRRKWAQQRFDSGLRQYAYVHAIQKVATDPLYNRDGRKAFNIKESDYFERVQEMETKTLKKWLDQRLGIVKARDLFGEELKKIGYPHAEGVSNTDLYFDWYNLQKRRIKENMRLKEVQKYEYLSALGYKREYWVRPTDMFDFKKEIESIIENEIKDKRLTSGELTSIIDQDPRVGVLLKGVELIGPDSTKLSELKIQAPEVYEEYQQKIENEAIAKISNGIENDIARYEGIALQMAEKYQDVQKLKELSEEMKRSFLLGDGDYNHFMMSKLYDMAAISLEQGEGFSGKSGEASQLKENYVAKLKESAVAIALDTLQNPGVAGSMRLEDHFIKVLNEESEQKALRDQMASDDYLREFRVMANWVVKFQFKKASLSVIPKAAVEVHDATQWEGQKRIDDYLKGLYYEQDLDKFRRETMRRQAPYMAINNGEQRFEYEQAWDFVLDKFPAARTR